MSSVLIVGYGVVGNNLHRELIALNPDIVDKNKPGIPSKTSGHYDFAFICVDTPRTKYQDCDIIDVMSAIKDNDADVYVIKSTVLPGTTELLEDQLGVNVVFSPEYYGATQHCNNYDFDFTILGGKKGVCIAVQQLLQNVYDASHKFHIVDSKTAEITKYMENSFIATKVSFCVQFYEICKKAGVDYEDVRELFILDPRVSPSHTFVYEDSPCWSSHCLDKDVAAITNKYDAKFLRSVIQYNNDCKENL